MSVYIEKHAQVTAETTSDRYGVRLHAGSQVLPSGDSDGIVVDIERDQRLYERECEWVRKVCARYRVDR